MMTPREALNLLDEAAAEYAGKRIVHIRLQQAVATLQVLVERVEQEEAANTKSNAQDAG